MEEPSIAQISPQLLPPLLLPVISAEPFKSVVRLVSNACMQEAFIHALRANSNGATIPSSDAR